MAAIHFLFGILEPLVNVLTSAFISYDPTLFARLLSCGAAVLLPPRRMRWRRPSRRRRSLLSTEWTPAFSLACLLLIAFSP